MSPDRYWCEHALVGGGVHSQVAIDVDGGLFSAVRVGVPRPPGAELLRGLTLPGLANAHSHAFHRALRSRTQAGRGSFWTWRDLMYVVAEQLDPENYHRLARACFAEMALAGISVVGEFHYVHHQVDGSAYNDPNAMGEALLAAAADAGIRITLLDTIYLHGGIGPDGYRAVDGVQRRFSDGSADAWADRVSALPTSETQRLGAAIHSVRAVDPGAMRVVRAWAEERRTHIHAHVSEQKAENEQCMAHLGSTPTGALDEAGILGDRFSAVHATHATSDDVALLAGTASTVCLCPTTERDLGDGIGPSAALADANVALSLGTDSHAHIDMFEEARAVELDQRLATHHRGTHKASALLAMALVDGHRSLCWDDAGVIAQGSRADLVTVTLESVRTAGSGTEALVAVVFAATAADVTDVVVDGVRIVEAGRHKRIDVAAELDASIAAVLAP